MKKKGRMSYDNFEQGYTRGWPDDLEYGYSRSKKKKKKKMCEKVNGGKTLTRENSHSNEIASI